MPISDDQWFNPPVLTGYWTLRSWEARKNLLLAASYIFYGTWNPPFALLLFATTALDFHLGARIATAGTAASRRGWLVASLISNLSMLGFFKSTRSTVPCITGS